MSTITMLLIAAVFIAAGASANEAEAPYWVVAAFAIPAAILLFIAIRKEEN